MPVTPVEALAPRGTDELLSERVGPLEPAT